MSELLHVESLQAWYGDSQVLYDVNLRVERGSVVALMGRNGMGKTTTIGAICGLLGRRGGTIRFDGHDLSGLPDYRIARLGLGLVPEGRRVFSTLSVRENLTAAATSGAWDLTAVYRLFPRLQERATQSAASLSGGEQQMLVIGRALMTNPGLLLLDEATEGLAPTVRREIWATLRVLKDEGMAILLVDKTLREILAIADHCCVLERGCSVWDGAPGLLDTHVADRYLGA